MSKFYVGLDVHSTATFFAIQAEDGTTIVESSLPTTPEGFRQIRDKFQLPPGTLVGLETGTVSFYVARLLNGLGLTPIVIDAREVRNKARRKNQKCDRRDARDVCHGIRTGSYESIVHVPPEQVLLLRETLSRRRHFVRMATAEVNAAKRLLRSAGRRDLATKGLKTPANWATMLRLVQGDGILEDFITMHFRAWESVRAQVAQLELKLIELEKLELFAASSRLLQTIPGVGLIVSLTVLAVLSNVGRFASAKRAASYVGIVPSTFHSGEREASGHITKRGSRELRAMLCEAAHHAAQPTHPLYPFFTELCVRRGYKMAVTAVAHRILRMAYAMLRDGTEFDITKVPVDEGPFTNTRVVTYRRKKKIPRQTTPA
jgi:transposase